MPKSAIIALAILGVMVGCAHAPAPDANPPTMSDASTAPSPDAETAETAETADPSDETAEAPIEVPEGTVMLVMEAEDLGGGPDAVVAAPKRPDLGSLLGSVGMAPSH